MEHSHKLFLFYPWQRAQESEGSIDVLFNPLSEASKHIAPQAVWAKGARVSAEHVLQREKAKWLFVNSHGKASHLHVADKHDLIWSS